MPTKDYPANVKMYKGEAPNLKFLNVNNVVVGNPLLGRSLIDERLEQGWRLTREPRVEQAPAPVVVPVEPAPVVEQAPALVVVETPGPMIE